MRHRTFYGQLAGLGQESDPSFPFDVVDPATAFTAGDAGSGPPVETSPPVYVAPAAPAGTAEWTVSDGGPGDPGKTADGLAYVYADGTWVSIDGTTHYPDGTVVTADGLEHPLAQDPATGQIVRPAPADAGGSPGSWAKTLTDALGAGAAGAAKLRALFLGTSIAPPAGLRTGQSFRGPDGNWYRLNADGTVTRTAAPAGLFSGGGLGPLLLLGAGVVLLMSRGRKA